MRQESTRICIKIIIFAEDILFKNRMDAISSWAKENYQLICLLVSVIGVIVGIITVIAEMKKKKKG